MAGITVSGVGSGLDINGLVSKLVAAEGEPATKRLNSREAGLHTQLSALGSFKGALADFQSAVSALAAPGKFQGMKATASDTGVLTASATNSTLTGSYGIEVKNLARAQSLAAAPVASLTGPIGTGTLTISFGAYNSEANTFTPNAQRSGGSITIDASNNSLEGVRDAVNKAKLGVSASIVNDGGGYRLVLSSTATGAANSLKIAVSDSDNDHIDAAGLSRLAYDPTVPLTPPAKVGPGRNLEETQSAQDAQVIVNGLSVSSAGNTVNEAVPGVKLDLKSAKPGTPIQLTVARDIANATGAVQAFVSAYNDLNGMISSLTAYNPRTRQGGPLLGDAQVRSISSQVQRVLGEPAAGDSAFRSLSSVGISVQRDGTLKLDSSKLQAAIEKDSDGVAKLFAGSEATPAAAETKGLADRLHDLLGKVLDDKGSLDKRTDSLNKRVDGIGDERAALERRLQNVGSRYQEQFSAMDKIVSQLTATGNFLTQQLDSLASMYKQK